MAICSGGNSVNRRVPLTTQATLFGDRLFVQYRPEAAHAYLRNVIAVGDVLAPGETQDDAARDLEVLPYVLLRRSYMHPFDLRREISRSTNIWCNSRIVF